MGLLVFSPPIRRAKIGDRTVFRVIIATMSGTWSAIIVIIIVPFDNKSLGICSCINCTANHVVANSMMQSPQRVRAGDKGPVDMILVSVWYSDYYNWITNTSLAFPIWTLSITTNVHVCMSRMEHKLLCKVTPSLSCWSQQP